MFKIDLGKIEEIKVCLDNGLVVHIQPIGMREDEKLRQAHTKGDSKATIDSLTLERTVYMPMLNHLEYNIELAKKSWTAWELNDPEGNPLKCNDENIEMFFDKHWEIAKSVLDKFDSIMLEQKKSLEGEKKT